MGEVEIWMPLYGGDTLAETARLTTRQFGAYQLLMIEYWRHGPLPNNDGTLRQITRLDKFQWKSDGPMVRAYFSEDSDGRLRNEHMDALKDKALENRRIAKERSAKANAARWGRDTADSAPSDAPRIPPRTPRRVLEHSPSPSSSKSPSRKEVTGKAGPVIPSQVSRAKIQSGDNPSPPLTPLQYASAMFERLCIPAGKTLKTTAAEAIRLNAVDCKVTEEESTALIEQAARDAQARGEAIKPWWFEDCKYKPGHQMPGVEAAQGMLQKASTSAGNAKARKERVVEHLEYCSHELQSKSAGLKGLRPISEELGALAGTVHKSESACDEAAIEADLTEMEERMSSVLERAAGPEEVTEIEKEGRADLGKRRREMNAKAARDVERQAVFKRLRESFQLPRLSLFYMDANEQARTNVEATHQPIEQ